MHWRLRAACQPRRRAIGGGCRRAASRTIRHSPPSSQKFRPPASEGTNRGSPGTSASKTPLIYVPFSSACIKSHVPISSARVPFLIFKRPANRRRRGHTFPRRPREHGQSGHSLASAPLRFYRLQRSRTQLLFLAHRPRPLRVGALVHLSVTCQTIYESIAASRRSQVHYLVLCVC